MNLCNGLDTKLRILSTLFFKSICLSDAVIVMAMATAILSVPLLVFLDMEFVMISSHYRTSCSWL